MICNCDCDSYNLFDVLLMIKLSDIEKSISTSPLIISMLIVMILFTVVVPLAVSIYRYIRIDK